MGQIEAENSAIFHSILAASKSFAYRCDNDEAVTMTFLAGNVEAITGCSARDLLQNAVRSYASLCHPDDLEPMIQAVDAAIAENEPWDLDYRLIQPGGDIVFVRERGQAVRDDAGEVAYLEGLVIDASVEAGLRADLVAREQQTKLANEEILDLSQNLAKSIRSLSMLSIHARIEAATGEEEGERTP